MELRDSYLVGSLTLFNYKGKLGIHQLERRLVFWVLEDAENHKWSKHIDDDLGSLEGNLIRHSRFVGMTGTDEFVWSYDDAPNAFYLTFYGLENETFTTVIIQGFDVFKHHRSISITTYLDYVENVTWLVSDKPLRTEPRKEAASGRKSEKPKSTQAHLVKKPNSIQKTSPKALSVNDKNRACEEKSRGNKRIATSSMETRCGPALSNRFAALDSLEDAG